MPSALWARRAVQVIRSHLSDDCFVEFPKDISYIAMAFVLVKSRQPAFFREILIHALPRLDEFAISVSHLFIWRMPLDLTSCLPLVTVRLHTYHASSNFSTNSHYTQDLRRLVRCLDWGGYNSPHSRLLLNSNDPYYPNHPHDTAYSNDKEILDNLKIQLLARMKLKTETVWMHFDDLI